MKPSENNMNAIFGHAGHVSAVVCGPKGLNFTHVPSGLDCRLTAVGGCGWRLEAVESGRGSFPLGAAQTLARYMDEPWQDDPQNLTSDIAQGCMTLSAEDGTKAVLSADPFAITFFAPDGRRMTAVTDLIKDPETGFVTVEGTMDPAEGVFGGGQRFDKVNQNGRELRIYSADMWNNSRGSYLSVPLFLFTGGYGLFLNSNAFTVCGFALPEDPTHWRLQAQANHTDCYVYASGSMKDALKGYTELSGHAAQPDAWNYGVIACRYAPDFDHLYAKDDVPGRLNKDNAPGGRGFETMTEAYRAANMPLKAVITEEWDYYRIFNSEQEKARWQESIDWLHAHGIKPMLYTRMASTIPDGPLSGFKEEYLVHASVTVNGVTKETVDIPDTAGDGVNPDAKVGASHRYVDITNPAAMDWYLETIWGSLIDMGFDGVKIDFCETFPDDGRNYGGTSVAYHWFDDTVMEKGTEHHAYPTLFISKFYRRMNELMDAKYGGQSEGFMALTRGGGIGSQRSPYMWGGDQVRDFGKLPDQLICVLTSGLSGVPFMTFDMAGYRYGGDGPRYADSDSLAKESAIMARAVEFTAFMTNIQTHGTVRSPYELLPETQEIYRRYVSLHSALSDVFDRLCAQASAEGVPPVRTLALEFPQDAATYSIWDEFMLGDVLLAAPILDADTTERSVYLPAGRWLDLLSNETLELGEGQTVTRHAAVHQIPLFLRLDSAEADVLRSVFAGPNWAFVRS